MNRNISYSVLVLAAAFAAACSGSEDMIGNEMTGSESSTAPLTVLGSSGGGIVNTGASYGVYNAFINVPGKWSVATSKGLANVYPSSGEGPTAAIVQVGENWGAVRENVLTLTAEEGTTRADGDNKYDMSIVQSGNPAMDSVSTVFSANKGAGYSYMPGGEYCDGALIQLFNLVTLDSIQRATGLRLISDVIYPETTQEIITSDSESGITTGLTVNASIGMNFGSVKSKNNKGGGGSGSGSIGVGVGKGHEEKSKNKYALKRQKTTQFTREIQYLNIMSLVEKATTREEKQQLFSPGFYSVQETFAKDIAAAKGNQTKQYDLCSKFLDEFGPCFISKSVMGCVLDYQISVDSTLLRDTLGVKVALEASFQTKVKNKDVGGKGSFSIGVSKEAQELLSKTTATVKVRGGDVSQVCILVTGGSLDDSDVTAWQNSCTPTKAVMVDMTLIPIYVLIMDDDARGVLMDYFLKKMNVEH
jgi:hypothetical protein